MNPCYCKPYGTEQAVETYDCEVISLLDKAEFVMTFFTFKNFSNRQIFNILLLLLCISAAGSLMLNLSSERANFAQWAESWLQNFSAEAAGAVAAFIFVTVIIDNRRRKQRLILDIRNSANDSARCAVDEMRGEGWLGDGSLQGLNLARAQLHGANLANADLRRSDLHDSNMTEVNLSRASLEGAQMMRANLTQAVLEGATLHRAKLENANLIEANCENAVFSAASLIGANLERADLWKANLQQAQLSVANLQNAMLCQVDLRAANLCRANLSGANLWFADLTGALQLSDAVFDPTTRLPDGTSWKPDTDLERFSNPQHPHYWQPVHAEMKPEAETIASAK